MKEKTRKILRRKRSVRHQLAGRQYRLSLSRSNKYLFAQIVDIKSGKTIIGLSNKAFAVSSKEEKTTKVEQAEVFGEEFGQKAVKQSVKQVMFDRGSSLYHGRVKAFAEGARKGGLEF